MFHFLSGEEMLEVLNKVDLYNPETGSYVFLYNECGSICQYDIDRDEAGELCIEQSENGDYWCAFLGVGGNIYDDPSCECYEDYLTSNIEYCNEVYDKGVWMSCTEYANGAMEVAS